MTSKSDKIKPFIIGYIFTNRHEIKLEINSHMLFNCPMSPATAHYPLTADMVKNRKKGRRREGKNNKSHIFNTIV